MSLKKAKNHIDHAFTRKELEGLSFENAFAGATSFLRRKYTKNLEGVDIAVTGVAFDQAVTNRPGTRLGPRAIREASTLQPFDPPFGWDFDPFTQTRIIDYGDVAFDYAKISEFPTAVKKHIKKIISSGVSAISFGGDHYISFPIIQAHVEKHGPLALLQFDAHSDTWPDNDFDRIDHGTMFYKAVKLGLIIPEKSVQVGIRTTNKNTLGFNIIDAREVYELGPSKVAEKIISIIGDEKTYLSFDIDCLDPAFAPGTGTPVSGGLSSIEANIIMREIVGINVVGGDIVEVCPPFDHSGVTAIAAAHIAVDLICLLVQSRNKLGM